MARRKTRKTKSSSRKTKKSSKQWFQFAVGGKRTGWKASQSPTTRRRMMYQAKHNYLRAARACQALANVTKDPGTKRAAHSDALYFYKMHKKTGK